jgi:hypothetical protein
MVQISGVNDRFLQKEVVLSEIMRILEPELVFEGIIPYVDSGGEPVTYMQKNSKSSDAKKQLPRMMTPSSKFPEVEITRMTKKSAILNQEGLAIRLDQDAIKKKAGVDMIMDAFNTVGFWLAEYVNGKIYDTLRAGGTDAGMSPTSQWSVDATATPMKDCRVFKNAMKREGYPYRCTDIYVDMTNFSEMEAFLTASDIPAYREAAMNGGDGDSMILPMPGKPTLHGLFSSVTHGDLFGLDRNHPGSSLYYNNDEQFSTPTITYETFGNAVNSTPVTKTVKNFGLSTHRFFEDDTHDTVIQIWMDYVVVTRDAYSVIKDDGI